MTEPKAEADTLRVLNDVRAERLEDVYHRARQYEKAIDKARRTLAARPVERPSSEALRELIRCVEKMVSVVNDADRLVWVDTRDWLAAALQDYHAAPFVESPTETDETEVREHKGRRVGTLHGAAARRARHMESPSVAACYDCGRPYEDSGFPDLVIPNDTWAAISPTGDGGGLLCPSCICERLVKHGFKEIHVLYTEQPKEVMPDAEEHELRISPDVAAPADPTSVEAQPVLPPSEAAQPDNGPSNDEIREHFERLPMRTRLVERQMVGVLLDRLAQPDSGPAEKLREAGRDYLDALDKYTEEVAATDGPSTAMEGAALQVDRTLARLREKVE